MIYEIIADQSPVGNVLYNGYPFASRIYLDSKIGAYLIGIPVKEIEFELIEDVIAAKV